MAKDMDSGNVEKALKHDCASHVVHEEWGAGRCIPEMHTIVEQEDGTGFVTHYDIMFEHGIENNVAVESVKVTKSEAHLHSSKKKKMDEKFAKVTKKTDDGDGMDPVGKGDADIDNDGDVDSSDKYLKKRRGAISKAIAKQEAKK
jgi:hypothetical protein